MFIGGFASRYRSVCILPFSRKNFTSKKGIEVVERSLVYLMVGWMTGGGGGYSQKNWVAVCGPLPKTLTPFMTKTYPIYDLTLKSNACFRAAS